MLTTISLKINNYYIVSLVLYNNRILHDDSFYGYNNLLTYSVEDNIIVLDKNVIVRYDQKNCELVINNKLYIPIMNCSYSIIVQDDKIITVKAENIKYKPVIENNYLIIEYGKYLI